MSKTGELDWGGSKEVISGLMSIGTGILKVFERPKYVTDSCDGLGRAQGGHIWTQYNWHWNLGSLVEARMCRRLVYWILEGPRRSGIELIRLTLASAKIR